MAGINKIYFIKRFFRRLKYAFSFKEIVSWESESCYKCGCNYRLCINAKQETWNKVVGSENGCLCANCFLTLAESKGIQLCKKDLGQIWVFNPNGKSFDISNTLKSLKEV